MVTAYALAREGVGVELIDQEDQTAGRSYACALHPRTLRVLAQLGLHEAILPLGRKVDTVAFYEGESRRGEIKFSKLPGEFPFLLAVPQNALEELLAQRLAQQFGIVIRWERRLADLEEVGEQVVTTIDKMCDTAKGYPIATWQRCVEQTAHSQMAFLVGADGRASHVRDLLHIEEEKAGEREHFAVFEFDWDAKIAPEVRVVAHNGTVSVLWPLPGKRWRWSFQLDAEEKGEDAPLKERVHFRLVDPARDRAALEQMRRLTEERAPWFDARGAEVDWSTTIDVERRIARRYGAGHCWLAGDSAHTTNPVGMQSMNVGLSEGAELAGILADIIHEKGSSSLLEQYEAGYRDEWRQLLGMERSVVPTDAASSWIGVRGAGLLPCVPASGKDLAHLLGQIGLQFRPARAA